MSYAVAYAYAYDYRDRADALVQRYAPLVKRIAHHLIGRLPETVSADDLIQAGMIGLLEAANSFDLRHGAAFETFAGIRIRGAMLDEVRKNDWVPRSVHKKARQVASAVHAVECREGRDAHDWEIARELGIGLEEYHRLTRDACACKVLSFDDLGSGDSPAIEQLPDEEQGILEHLQREDLQRTVADAIASLPERERMVMILYYDEGLNLREIGQVLGVSESRVCQIHGQALLRLKGRLGGVGSETGC